MSEHSTGPAANATDTADAVNADTADATNASDAAAFGSLNCAASIQCLLQELGHIEHIEVAPTGTATPQGLANGPAHAPVSNTSPDASADSSSDASSGTTHDPSVSPFASDDAISIRFTLRGQAPRTFAAVTVPGESWSDLAAASAHLMGRPGISLPKTDGTRTLAIIDWLPHQDPHQQLFAAAWSPHVSVRACEGFASLHGLGIRTSQPEEGHTLVEFSNGSVMHLRTPGYLNGVGDVTGQDIAAKGLQPTAEFQHYLNSLLAPPADGRSPLQCTAPSPFGAPLSLMTSRGLASVTAYHVATVKGDTWRWSWADATRSAEWFGAQAFEPTRPSPAHDIRLLGYRHGVGALLRPELSRQEVEQSHVLAMCTSATGLWHHAWVPQPDDSWALLLFPGNAI